MSEKEAKQLSEAEILLLHRKSNPADDLYEGKATDDESETPEVVQGPPAASVDVLNQEEIDTAQKSLEETKGTTAHSTEDVTKSGTDTHKEEVAAKAKTNARNS